MQKMANAIEIDEAHKLKNPQRSDGKIGRIVTNLLKFAVDSSVDVSLKGVTGPKKLYKIVQERFKNPPASLPLNNCKKPADVKSVEEMLVGDMLYDMVKLMQQSETSAEIVEGKYPLKKGPNEGNGRSNILAPEKKRIFIRSRL